MEIEDYEKYELDTKKTIYSNIVKVFSVPIMFYYIVVFANLLNKFETQEDLIIMTFIFAYSSIKFVSIVCHNFNFEYKLRK